MKIRRKHRSFVAVVLAGAVFASACGSDDPQTSPTTPSATTGGSPATTVAGTPTTTGSTGAPTTTAPREHKTMNVLSLTGTTGEIIQKLYEPFEKEFNVTINWVSGASSENLAKLRATKAKPEYDVAVLDDLSAYTASVDGVAEKIDEKIVTHLADVYPAAKTPNNDGVAWGVAITGIVYNTATFASKNLPAPKSWEDLFKPELCNGFGMASFSGSSSLKATMMLGGMDKDGKNTDAAVKAGLNKLKTISKCFPTFEASVGALDTKISTNVYSHAIQPSTSSTRMKADGLPVQFVVPEPGSVGVFTTNVPIKGAPNPELAQQFVNYFLRPDVQLQIAEQMYYSPLNKNVTLPQRLTDLGVPGASAVAGLYTPDYAVVAKERATWSGIFDREVATK